MCVTTNRKLTLTKRFRVKKNAFTAGLLCGRRSSNIAFNQCSGIIIRGYDAVWSFWSMLTLAFGREVESWNSGSVLNRISD